MNQASLLKPQRRRIVIAIAGAATLGYLGLGYAVDATHIREAVEALGWIGCSAVLALSAFNYLVRFQRWQMFLSRLGHRLAFGEHLLCYLSGFAFTVSPGKTGEAIRSLYLKEHGVSYSESIGALFVERLQDLLAMALLATLVVFQWPAYRPLIACALAAVVGMVFAASRESFATRLERVGTRLANARVARALAAVTNLMHSARRLLQPQFLILGTAVGALSWGGEGLGYYLICQGLHIPVNCVVAIGIYALAVLAGSAAVFLPAGLGGTEIVMTTLLASQGASLRIAFIAALLCRLATLWFAVLIGIGAALVLELRVRPAPALNHE